jgi:branched-chain amino acid transport system permease protein
MRGIFFSIATIALTIIIETFIINWKFVGGATGMPMVRPPVMPPFDSYVKMLFVNGAVDGGDRRGTGALHSELLDRPRAAGAARRRGCGGGTGVPTLKLKLTACVISGA